MALNDFGYIILMLWYKPSGGTWIDGWMPKFCTMSCGICTSVAISIFVGNP